MSSTPSDYHDLLALRLEYFHLSKRTTNCLLKASIETIGALVALRSSDVRVWPNAGKKTLRELQFLLQTVGLKLADDEAPSPADQSNLAASSEASQELLARRLDQFDLSARATNCLVNAKVATIGALAALRSNDILGWPNAGRKTLSELRVLLGSVGLKLSDDVVPTPALEDLASEKAATLEEGLDRFLRLAASERNAEVLIRLWGWNGQAPRTLESVGREFGITRERVRQIEKRALPRLRKYRLDVSHVEAAIAALREATPDSESALSSILRERGISGGEFCPESVKSCARYLGVEWPFKSVSLGDVEILSLGTEGDKYQKLRATLRKNTSKHGCVNLLGLASDLGLEESEIPRLSRVLALVPNVAWLDESRNWLYSTDQPRSRLYNLCAKVLGVAPRVHLSELRRAVSKARRMGMCPPQRVLGAFVERSGLGSVHQSIVQAKPGSGTAPAEDSAEGVMLRVLNQYGPLMDGEVFADRCVSAGVNATTFYIYRAVSPVVSALGKGVFCKVGTNVPPGAVEEIVRRRGSHSRVSDHGWTSDGRLWFGLQLTRQVIVAGGIWLPAFVKDLVQGEWHVVLPDKSKYGTVMCRDLFLWSVRRHFAILGAEPNDLAAFEFDLKTRQVLVRVGGQDLFEAIQDSDAAIPEGEIEEA